MAPSSRLTGLLPRSPPASLISRQYVLVTPEWSLMRPERGPSRPNLLMYSSEAEAWSKKAGAAEGRQRAEARVTCRTEAPGVPEADHVLQRLAHVKEVRALAVYQPYGHLKSAQTERLSQR